MGDHLEVVADEEAAEDRRRSLIRRDVTERARYRRGAAERSRFTATKLDLAATTVVRLQHALGVPADGILGPATQEALRAAQAENGLPPTGEPDERTLTVVLGSGWDAPARVDDLSEFVSSLRASLGDRPVSAWELVERIAGDQSRAHYGGGTASAVLEDPPPPRGSAQPLDLWLDEIRQLYVPLVPGRLGGRKLLAGLAMLDPAVGERLSDHGFLATIEAESGIEQILSPEGRTRRAADRAPTVSDRPATEDELGRLPFVRLLASRLVDEYTTTEELARERARAEGRDETKESVEADSFMVHLEGPWGSGKSTILNLLANQLRQAEPPWVVAEFNVWRHQRVGPPWWLLVKVLYRAARDDERLPRATRRRLWLDRLWWRIRLARRGLTAVAVGIAVIVALGLTGNLSRGNPLGVFTAAMTTITSAVLSFRSLASALSAGAPQGAGTFVRSTQDPMKELRLRFRALVKRIGRPIAIFVDDVDRCRSDYVVELLEGIQTTLRSAPVTFVIAADRRWLYDSYQEVYSAHESMTNDPGRPLGHLFLEKSFQLSASVPRLNPAARRGYLNRLAFPPEREDGARAAAAEAFDDAHSETEIVERLAAAEEVAASEAERERAREAAIDRLAAREVARSTEHYLGRFAHLLEANPRAIKRLLNAYLPALALELSEGRVTISSREKDQFVLWLIVNLRWPLLADYLAERPAAADELVTTNGEVPQAVLDDKDRPYLARLYREPGVQRVIAGDRIGTRLDARAIRRLLAEPNASDAAGSPH